MSKFKVGDKVRCIRYHGGDVKVGDIGVCIGPGRFDFPNHKSWHDLSGAYVELVEASPQEDEVHVSTDGLIKWKARTQ